MSRLFVFAALLFALPAHAEVSMDWVTVGDPGNACEVQSQGCFGAIAYSFLVGKYEVTNAQYAEFLNAVAVTDTNALYNTNMASGVGGITRSGSSGSYTYSAIAGREDMPVNYVSWYDSLRFANWLHNGQPTGAQDSTTTEDGAYTMITESYPDGPLITRNVDATIFLTSEDEWYKAAYHAGSGSYYDYPAGSDTQTPCAVPGATANTANCSYVVSDLTDGGSYTGSASPSGSFDQGGNLWEWNEAIVNGVDRSLRGGGYYFSSAGALAASNQDANGPSSEYRDLGFRVASLAEPEAVPSLSRMGVALTGWLVFGIGLVGLTLAARRRRD